MEQLQMGEELFATITVVGLTALSIIALAQSYRTYAERRSMCEGFNLALDIADQLRNDVLARHEDGACPGLINPATFQLELQSYSQLLARQGIGLRVEVRTLDGELAIAYGSEPDMFGQYFSPPCSVSLPVAIAQTPASKPLGELIVTVWR